jgi:NADH-quinone oxidoreductase subunit C
VSDETVAEETDEEAAPEPEPETAWGVPVSWSGGQQVLHPDAEGYLALAQTLKDDGFVMAVDVTAVDYLTYTSDRALPPGVEAGRFEVVASLFDHEQRRRVRIRVQLGGEEPSLASLYELWPGTDAMEREVYDMYGITFEGHPDMTRILMPEDWVGHPLRKDQPQGKIPVQFKSVTNSR